MDAIETKTIERNGQTFRISIYADADAPNPLEEWSEMGTILSLNSRHNNYDPAGIEEAIETNADAVKLSYYEHGLCRWSVAGELPAAAHCPWDSVSFAGIWLPDAETLESAKPLRRQDTPAFHAEACPRSLRSLHAVVQRRHLRLRSRA